MNTTKTKMSTMILVSLVTALVVSIASLFIFSSIDKKAVDTNISNVTVAYNLQGANKYVGNWTKDEGFFASHASAPTYKLLKDQPVATEVIAATKNETTHIGSVADGFTSIDGQSLMQFFYPTVTYDKTDHVSENLDRITEGEIIEIALSFNEAYTFEEMKAIVPSKVNLQWVMADVYTEEQIEGFKAHLTDESFVKAQSILETEAIGFPLRDRSNEAIENPEQTFIDLLAKVKDLNKEDYALLHQAAERVKKVEDIKVIGAVVTATAEEIESLLEVEEIVGLSFGTKAKLN